MEGSGTLPFTTSAKVNKPASTSTIQLFVDSATGHLSGVKSDGSVVTAAVGGVAVIFA